MDLPLVNFLSLTILLSMSYVLFFINGLFLQSDAGFKIYLFDLETRGLEHAWLSLGLCAQG